MKLNSALIVIALALSSSTDANIMVRRRPHHDVVAHRRNLEVGRMAEEFEEGVSSLFNAFHRSAPSSSASSSTSSAPSSSTSSSSSSGNTSTSQATSASQSRSRSQAPSQSSNGLFWIDWFGHIFGGNSNGRSSVSSDVWPFGPSTNNPLSSKPKLGLAWPNGDSMNITHFITNKVSWYYTWSPTPSMENPPSEITFCPMLWGTKQVDSFRKHVFDDPDADQNRGKCVMGMNEVNQDGQADMSVSEACSLMRDHIVPLRQNHDFYVISPSTTSAPSGKKWMSNFRRQCSDVWDNIDALSLHYYDTNVTAFKEYVRDWHETYNKPIWVTEYACQNFNGGKQCSDVDTFVFHKEISSWFDQQDYVQAYAPFGVMQQMQGVNPNNQLTSNGSPNILFDVIASR